MRRNSGALRSSSGYGSGGGGGRSASGETRSRFVNAAMCARAGPLSLAKLKPQTLRRDALALCQRCRVRPERAHSAWLNLKLCSTVKPYTLHSVAVWREDSGGGGGKADQLPHAPALCLC